MTKAEARGEIDRIAPRGRPEGTPLMQQTWENLLFLHWQIDPQSIRPLIPAPLEIDLFENHAWIGITPFTVSDLKAESLPAIPGLSSFHELNVRTYVHHKGVPGVWFFSLDASKILPALAARVVYSLPYHKAAMEFSQAAEHTFHFSSKRMDESRAEFSATWKTGMDLRSPSAASLAFFLVERYSLYSAGESGIYRARIYHSPWQLREAQLLSFRSTLLTSLGLPEPISSPLIHFAERQKVDIWPNETILPQ